MTLKEEFIERYGPEWGLQMWETLQDLTKQFEARILELEKFRDRLMENPQIADWVNRRSDCGFYNEHNYPGKE